MIVCGTGVGAAITARTRYTGIRTAVRHDVHSAHQAVEHDDVDVPAAGAQIVGEWLALDLIRAYCDATFELREPFLHGGSRCCASWSGRSARELWLRD